MRTHQPGRLLPKMRQAWPQGWEPTSVERGFKRGDNVVTVLPPGCQRGEYHHHDSDYADAEKAATSYLHRIAGVICGPKREPAERQHPITRRPDFAPGLLLLPRTWADNGPRFGWDKLKMTNLVAGEHQEYLGHARCSSAVSATTLRKSTGACPETQTSFDNRDGPEQVRKCLSSAGRGPVHQLIDDSYGCRLAKQLRKLVSTEIRRPGNWERLIKWQRKQISVQRATGANPL